LPSFKKNSSSQVRFCHRSCKLIYIMTEKATAGKLLVNFDSDVHLSSFSRGGIRRGELAGKCMAAHMPSRKRQLGNSFQARSSPAGRLRYCLAPRESERPSVPSTRAPVVLHTSPSENNSDSSALLTQRRPHENDGDVCWTSPKYAEHSPALDEENLTRLTHVHEYSPQRT
jgi:hypothetical protein